MKDNSTGKNKDFYDLGKKMFDRLNPPGTPEFKPYFPKREWVGLTPADFEKLEQLYGHQVSNDFAFANIVCQVESLLQEKNT
jgi:hypothetical protein